MREDQTRRELIDSRLELAGWNVQDRSQVRLELPVRVERGVLGEEESSRYDAGGIVDYGLKLDHRVGAVIEAKRTLKDAEAGQRQAENYARVLEATQGEMPFAFYSNGFDIFFWELGEYPPARVHGFPNRDELEWLAQRRRLRQDLTILQIDQFIVDRGYQLEAVRSILEAAQRQRTRFLLVMATGTGKTRTALALADVLKRARWVRRVLFLVDRIALRDQALDAFERHLPAEPRWPQGRNEDFVRDRRIFVTTYPAMLNLIERADEPRHYISPFFFDLVIADESHRSLYNVYKQVLDYFHAFKLGLTATPRDHVDRNTFEIFGCPPNQPTFGYEYEDAVAHDPPYLTRFEVLRVRSKFQIEGIHGHKLGPAEQRRLVAEGKDLAEIDFEGTELERKVTNSGTNALILRELMEESIKDPGGVLPGKTILFAISKGHAYRLQELFNSMYPEHRGELVRVLVSGDDQVHGKGGLLDDFKYKDMPRIAISVDMLDTGVDVPEVVNLVFAKPVYSYIKFWQMIGRGTRVLDSDPAKRRPWCPEKDVFLIIDCWGNFEYFDMEPDGREPGAQVPLPVRLFRARLDRLEAAWRRERSDVVARVKADLQNDLEALPANNVVVSENAAHLARVQTEGFFADLRPDDLRFLRQDIAAVFRVRSDLHPKSARFETEVQDLGTAVLEANPAAAGLAEGLRSQIDELPLSVNVVARERGLIEAARQPDWWLDWDAEEAEAKLDQLTRLTPLMEYRQKRSGAMMRLDLNDLVAIRERQDADLPAGAGRGSAAYREKIESWLRDLVADNPVLAKLRDGEDLSETEVKAIAELLRRQDPKLDEDMLRKVYDHKTARFTQLLRHALTGEPLPDWQAELSDKMDDLVARHPWNSLQIRFLRTLKTYLLQRGRVTKKDLVSQPFTRIHPGGAPGVFPPHRLEEILGELGVGEIPA